MFFLTDLSTGAFSATPNRELAGSQLNVATFVFDPTTGAHPRVLLVTLTGTNYDQYIFAAEKE